ncbi:DUF1707 SHOCT-like domain-containing protein [Candidatus Blastococcus massiliensis]|uniref:DUF1707 SHOCT-like domain-containing protein n=1 Tax=Candidatus Blastococcus massiliensis TaxID=1470358 RepID=UPI0004AFC9B8|nr:DUF1707 domain-containing protein [Candidatus Blastococcus massiliensis]
MTHSPELRVADRDRAAAADRLRAAHDEGRLDLLEYDRRLADAYAAVTYGDLDRLFTDLPPTSSVPAYSVSTAAVAARAAGRSVARRPAGFPLALKILWTVWASVVAVNVTVWLLVSLGVSDPVHFWPMWLAVPGVLLGIGTTITMHVRNNAS